MNLPSPILLTVEKAIDAVLRMDSDTRDRLALMDGKQIRVNIDTPPVSVILSISDGSVLLVQPENSDELDTSIDTTINGSVPALVSLLKGNDALYRGEVLIEGDIGVSQTFKQIIEQLDPDWQDAVSPIIGDSLTHRVDIAQSRFVQWLKRSGQTTRLNTSEYLQEEVELLAPNSEVIHFCEEVDDLRAAADRLCARVEKLEAVLATQDDES